MANLYINKIELFQQNLNLIFYLKLFMFYNMKVIILIVLELEESNVDILMIIIEVMFHIINL